MSCRVSKAKVARHRQVTPATKTIPLDNGNNRLRYPGYSVGRRINRDFIVGTIARTRPYGSEFRDVRPDAEVTVGTGEDDGPDLAIFAKLLENLCNAFPHR